MRETTHKQVCATMPERVVEVDEGLQRILPALWERGLFTLASCADRENDHRAYVLFEEPWMAAVFVEMVLGSAERGAMIALLMDGSLCGETAIGIRDGWFYHKVYFRMSVEFPPSAIAEIEAAFCCDKGRL